MAARVKITDRMIDAAIWEIELHAMRDGVKPPTEEEQPEAWAKMRAAIKDALAAAAAVAVESR